MTGNICPKCPQTPTDPKPDRKPMTIRPTVQPRPYAWKAKDRSETPGIALWGKNGLTAHLTPLEARILADRLHDLADAAGNPEPKLPTTEAERE